MGLLAVRLAYAFEQSLTKRVTDRPCRAQVLVRITLRPVNPTEGLQITGYYGHQAPFVPGECHPPADIKAAARQPRVSRRAHAAKTPQDLDEIERLLRQAAQRDPGKAEPSAIPARS